MSRKIIKRIIERILKWWKKGKSKLTVEELYKELKHYNKSILIKEIIVQSQKRNKNQCGVPIEFKQHLRSHSKKQLIKVLIVLRLESDRKFRKLEAKILKTKKLTNAYS